MKTHEMLNSKFLKKEDVGEGTLVTIDSIAKANIAKEGADPEYKYAMSFVELDKPLVLNNTNIQLCARALESDDSDDWIGKQIVLYDDPNVSYRGELVGGIRIRKPKQAPKKPIQTKTGFEDMSDDIPF